MKQLESSVEIIRTSFEYLLNASDTSMQPHEDQSYRFIGSFHNGDKFDLILSDQSEIECLREALQLNLRKQYVKFSRFKAFADLIQGKKYTMVIGTELGMGVHAIQFYFQSVEFGKYAQYLDSAKIVFRPKRKRNLHSIRLYGSINHSKEFILWDGWVEPETDWMTPPEVGSTPDVTVQRSKYQSFDSRYFLDALKSVEKTPITHNLSLDREGGVK